MAIHEQLGVMHVSWAHGVVAAAIVADDTEDFGLIFEFRVGAIEGAFDVTPV